MTIGALIAAFAPLLLAIASTHEQLTGQKVSLVWALGFHIVNDIGFSMVFPVGSHCSRVPRHARSVA